MVLYYLHFCLYKQIILPSIAGNRNMNT
jgi:hypothetical protein